MSRFRFRIACVALAAACAQAPVAPPAPEAPLPPSPERETEACPSVESVEVHIRRRELRAACEDGGSIVLSVALGRRSDGPKQRRGDRRTPHGVYHVANAARSSRFHLFIPIDYPSRHDAAQALARGSISEATWRRIVRAHESGLMPPQDTALGGHLGLHGEGPRWQGASAHLDWTLGCIALRDSAIEFLARRLSPGTPILVFP